jgi:hypothetical protein
MNMHDPTCDFDAFVAQRRGISSEQAQQLIQSWLLHSCPRGMLAITSSSPAPTLARSFPDAVAGRGGCFPKHGRHSRAMLRPLCRG